MKDVSKLPVWAQREFERLQNQNAVLKRENEYLRRNTLGDDGNGLKLFDYGRQTDFCVPTDYRLRWDYPSKRPGAHYVEVSLDPKRLRMEIRAGDGGICVLPRTSNTFEVAPVEIVSNGEGIW